MKRQGFCATAAGLSVLGILSSATAGGIGGINPVEYRVTGQYYVGCVDPCLCPFGTVGQVNGTFQRTTVPVPMVIVPIVQVYDINDLAMTLTSAGGSRQDITGSGVYRIFSIPTFQHQMQLDLNIGGQILPFDSGLVPGGSDLPEIDIDVALDGIFECHVSVFSLHASPIHQSDLNHDGVVDSLDLGILLSDWSIPATAPGCTGEIPCPSDLDHNGHVDSIDLGVLLSDWTL